MPKFKDYFTKLKEQAKIKNEEFDKFLESIPDGELPDSIFNLIEDNFLTRERALADPKIYGKVRYETLSGVDAIIKDEIIPNLHVFNAAEIDQEPDTFKKLKKIRNAVTESLEKAKKDIPNNDEKIKELKKVNEDLTKRITDINSAAEKSLKEKDQEWNNKFKSVKMDYALRSKVGKFTFADEFEKDRETVTEVILTKVGKNHLDFSENGDIHVFDLEGGVAKPKFNGNDPVTLDKLLEDAVKPYIKRNNVDGDGGDNGKHVIKTVEGITDINKTARIVNRPRATTKMI